MIYHRRMNRIRTLPYNGTSGINGEYGLVCEKKGTGPYIYIYIYLCKRWDLPNLFYVAMTVIILRKKLPPGNTRHLLQPTKLSPSLQMGIRYCRAVFAFIIRFLHFINISIRQNWSSLRLLPTYGQATASWLIYPLLGRTLGWRRRSHLIHGSTLT